MILTKERIIEYIYMCVCVCVCVCTSRNFTLRFHIFFFHNRILICLHEKKNTLISVSNFYMKKILNFKKSWVMLHGNEDCYHIFVALSLGLNIPHKKDGYPGYNIKLHLMVKHHFREIWKLWSTCSSLFLSDLL